MKLDELIHYRPPQQAPTTKTTALRLLLWLLGLLLLCTLLSRAASSITLPQVTVEKPIQASITHTVEAQGSLSPLQEVLVTTREGILVERVVAGEGQPVQVGDTLFTLSADSIARQMRQEQVALQKLQLELSSQQLGDQVTVQREQLDYERAYEDYSRAFDRSYSNLEDARQTRGEALNAVRAYYVLHKEIIDRWQNSHAPGISSIESEELKIVNQYRQLQGEYEAADIIYEAARDSRSDSWKSAQRGMEDAQLALDWDADRQAEILGLTLALQEESVKELQRLVEDGGAVRSPIDGVVSRLTTQAGSPVGQGAAAMIAREDGGFRFVAEVTEDDLEYIEYGGAATVSFPTGRPVKVTLDGVRGQTVSATLPQGEGEPGSRGVLQLSHRGASYPTCVPMSALRSDGIQKYVMILRETDTVLGKELVAERVDVQLEENNETRAAVSGALQESDRVIVAATKPVRAGDRVRMAAQ